MIKRGVGIILIKNGKILLVRAKDKSLHLNDTFSFPGGHINERETEEEAARREFNEESGLTVGKLTEFPGNYIESETIRKDGKVQFSFKAYLATDYSGEIRTTDETEPFWIDVDEARKLKLFACDNEVLENAVKFLNS